MDRIVVVGSANIDLVVRAPRLPRPGETVGGARFYTAPGGKGANQAVAAARLGAEVYLVGRVGADAFGDQVRGSLQAAGVRLDFLVRDADEATGVALITVDSSGQNTIVVAPGANHCLTTADVEAAEAIIGSAQVVMAQLETPEDTVAAAASLARRYGAKFLLNPAPFRPVPAEVLRSAAVVTPNEIECQGLTGLPVESPDEAARAGQSLLTSGAPAVVVTLGSRGAMLCTPEAARHFPAWDVQAVDATAAGDAFAGGLAVALAAGRGLADAVYYAGAVAALSVTRPGAQPSMPGRAEVETFMSRQLQDRDGGKPGRTGEMG